MGFSYQDPPVCTGSTSVTSPGGPRGARAQEAGTVHCGLTVDDVLLAQLDTILWMDR
jgi:nicotinamide mononucleotide (NMN) deamidase PncC